MKYRKKPVVIEAVECVKGMGSQSWKELPKWLTDAYEIGNILFENDGISIYTLEGWMKANIGDMIIQGVKGEIYSCKPDIFKLTYEEAAE